MNTLDETLLKEIISSNKKYTNYGQVASYIPELKNARRNDLGICIIDSEIIFIVLETVAQSLLYKVFQNQLCLLWHLWIMIGKTFFQTLEWSQVGTHLIQ